ncbi:hypothetical protein HWV07_13070 [Natronomonas salina]|uniref:DUF7533 family protein n=1 Tax=Natronomonas salina TaxID=1710540 RepID=UPI0015B683D5|nr:hypothetical protein [Natronomonas salina]QLD89908.1 hypothetical protein HWV07_13070 [Natronomonas salina]
MGLIDTISLYGTAVLAIPIALLGIEFLVFGDRPVTGAVFLGLGAALLLGQYYLPDLKGELLGGASDVVLGDAADPDAGDERDGGHADKRGSGHADKRGSGHADDARE